MSGNAIGICAREHRTRRVRRQWHPSLCATAHGVCLLLFRRFVDRLGFEIRRRNPTGADFLATGVTLVEIGRRGAGVFVLVKHMPTDQTFVGHLALSTQLSFVRANWRVILGSAGDLCQIDDTIGILRNIVKLFGRSLSKALDPKRGRRAATTHLQDLGLGRAAITIQDSRFRGCPPATYLVS